MDMLKITNPEIGRNYRFRSFFTAITKCSQNKKSANKCSCSFSVTSKTEPIGQFKFDYSIAIDGRVTLLRMQISKFEKGIFLKVANYNFETFLLRVFRFKEICQVKLDQKGFKKLIDLFCHEYELNADRKTFLSLFTHCY